ncbi:CDP-glycerol glycerophosphotransferase family protein [Aurantibacter sp.]|uniref:CDP-glycerol glycerophosphotransferase family protein n=1 Tax=Aurantibacter sp. TaxID=2807103 RepID=UPI0032661C2C
MKRFLFFLIEKIFFSIICAIVPVRKNLILFGSGFNKFSDNPKFLFFHFQKKHLYTSIWISSNRSEVKEMRKCGFKCVYKWSFQALWVVVRASKWIISHKGADVFPFTPKRTVIINLWHGTPIKKIGYDSLKEREWIDNILKSGRKLPYERWNYFITASENANFIFKGAMHLNDSKLKALGQPRNQFIYDTYADKELTDKLKNRAHFLKNFEDRKLILYTPTFRNNMQSTNHIKDSLVSLNSMFQEKQEHILLFKPHPLDKAIFDSGFFEQLQNVINVSSEDTQELLCISDVLITDYSSILFDFMITKKPIIAYVFDYSAYVKASGGLYFSFDEIGITIAHNKDELIGYLLNIDSLTNTYNSNGFNTPNSSEKISSFIAGLD